MNAKEIGGVVQFLSKRVRKQLLSFDEAGTYSFLSLEITNGGARYFERGFDDSFICQIGNKTNIVSFLGRFYLKNHIKVNTKKLEFFHNAINLLEKCENSLKDKEYTLKSKNI